MGPVTSLSNIPQHLTVVELTQLFPKGGDGPRCISLMSSVSFHSFLKSVILTFTDSRVGTFPLLCLLCALVYLQGPARFLPSHHGNPRLAHTCLLSASVSLKALEPS